MNFKPANSRPSAATLLAAELTDDELALDVIQAATPLDRLADAMARLESAARELREASQTAA